MYTIHCMTFSELHTVAKYLVSPGKGILASDESVRTLEKHFDEHGIAKTDENRRAYRELLFTAPGANKYISGAILFDETIQQKTASGERFVEVLRAQGIVPGIKVDLGTEPLGTAPGEMTTKGIEGLAPRLAEYFGLGAQFAKWRAVFTISDTTPSEAAIEVNADLLAEYARLCQAARLVPIVEPEVLMDGVHTIEQCYEASVRVQTAVFEALAKARVEAGAMLLKPNMIVPGSGVAEVAPRVVAAYTLSCLQRTAPSDLAGVVFLSGGQSDATAVANLRAIAQEGADASWPLTYSFGRALQTAALATWQGKPENVAAAQAVFTQQAARCSQAVYE